MTPLGHDDHDCARLSYNAILIYLWSLCFYRQDVSAVRDALCNLTTADHSLMSLKVLGGWGPTLRYHCLGLFFSFVIVS